MSTSGLDDQNEQPSEGHRSEMSGSASEVVQARDVQGGIHFHRADHPSESVPRQLPGDVSGFVNRQGELRRLDEVLAAERDEPMAVGVYVITGTAGVGKTSLALHWAHGIRRRFPDGQLYVNLRGYDPGPPVSPEQALDRFLRALGVQPNAIPGDLDDRAALYRSLLSDRRMLVVLDNAASARQVRPLLPGTAECLVLVTSRSRLSGLVARNGARRLSLDVLSEQDAVDLLRVITSGYRRHDDPAELAELTRLCARLPLALRIAAERASSRPLMLLNELITDLRDESALWDALTAEDDEEADAVRTVFAWSYRALPEAAARMFRLLGLHPGPSFGVPAAVALTGLTPNQVRHLLDVLVGAHMLEQHTPGRYQFHDLLRAYASDQAIRHETTVDRHVALERVLSWYLRMAHVASIAIAPLNRNIMIDSSKLDPSDPPISDSVAAFRWHDEERENLVAAARAAEAAGLHRLAWQLPAVLRNIYARLNPFEDWIATGRIGLASARHAEDRYGEAFLLESLGMAYVQSRRLTEAEECHLGALTIREEIGDRLGMAASSNGLGLLAWREHRLAAAELHFMKAAAIYREHAERRWEARSLSNLGMTYQDLGRYAEAVDVLEEAVTICRSVGDRYYEGNALLFLAMAQRELGYVNEAMSSIQGALTIAYDNNSLVQEAFWLLELARIQRVTGRPEDALVSYQRSAAVQRQLGDRSREAMALDGTGEAYRELGMPEEAAKFHRLAAVIHQELRDRWHLAVALRNLGIALSESERPERARPHWTEAATILAEFDDAKAVRMRDQLAMWLSGPR